MKKSVALVALAFGVTSAFAQDLTSKKGEPILPEAGDWAVSIDATPFFGYAKSLIGAGVGTTSPTWNFNNANTTIFGKMFKDEKTAYRAGIALNFGSQKWTNLVNQDGSTATPTPKVTDEYKLSSRTIGLSAGIEFRRGKTRLQGYYGGDFGITLGGGKSTYTYGNAFSSTNPTPTSTTVWPGPNSGNGVGARTTEAKNGSTFGLGLRGFIGAEYFLFPKISVGGEFGWGLGFSSTGEGETTTESWNGTGVTTTTSKTGKSSSFGIGTDNINNVFGPAGTLRLNLHF